MFVYPITDFEPIDHTAQTLGQFRTRLEPGVEAKLDLVLWKQDFGWILTTTHPTDRYAYGSSDAVKPRIFRTTSPIMEPLHALGIKEVTVPVATERQKIHSAFMEKRRVWLQKQMRAHKVTNQIIGDRVGLHNAYVSYVLNGTHGNPVIEQAICDAIGARREDVFPAIPDQVL